MTADQPASGPTHVGIERGISAARFQSFRDAANMDESIARDLYVWNRDLSVAILADIAILEVALRNSMHDAATSAWGMHWYARSDIELDDRTARQLSRSWGYLRKSVRNRPNDDDVPGRLVAQCTLGFWTNLLDSGSFRGEHPRRQETDYDRLWHGAFKYAFPGGRPEAKKMRRATASDLPNFTREWAHSVCKVVNELRNRVAHHEPLINGFPLNGQQSRMSAKDGHAHCMLLARMLDRDLAAWLHSNSTVDKLLGSRPS